MSLCLCSLVEILPKPIWDIVIDCSLCPSPVAPIWQVIPVRYSSSVCPVWLYFFFLLSQITCWMVLVWSFSFVLSVTLWYIMTLTQWGCAGPTGKETKDLQSDQSTLSCLVCVCLSLLEDCLLLFWGAMQLVESSDVVLKLKLLNYMIEKKSCLCSDLLSLSIKHSFTYMQHDCGYK